MRFLRQKRKKQIEGRPRQKFGGGFEEVEMRISPLRGSQRTCDRFWSK
jgi:hypothetical protein